MSEHFPRNTVSAQFWCSKCSKFTAHRIDSGRKGPCLECIAKLDQQHDAKKPVAPAEEQRELFA